VVVNFRSMKCVVCKPGETRDGKATLALERGDVTVVFKKFPVLERSSCSDEDVNDATSKRPLHAAGDAARDGDQVEVRE
jgi:hypothetical protein